MTTSYFRFLLTAAASLGLCLTAYDVGHGQVRRPAAAQSRSTAPATKPAATPSRSAARANTPASSAAPAAAQALDEKNIPIKKVSPDEFYTPPKSKDVKELTAFLGQLLAYDPTTQQELEIYQQRAPQAMNYAANLIIQLEKDRSSDGYRMAAHYLLAMQLMELDKKTEAERQKLLAQISGMLGHEKLDPDDLDLAVAFAETLEFLGDHKAAVQAYVAFSKLLAKNTDPLVVELSKTMTASARRLSLVGRPIQVIGKTVDGKRFDWKQYRGKVVLIDFWATWCGPCVAEVPNMKKLHDLYNKSGFEIVGISMDSDPAQLQAFLKKNQLPWVTLNEGEAATNPTAEFYGVSALPTAILVDRQGNVVSLSARGQELEKLLSQQFGTASKPETSPLRRK